MGMIPDLQRTLLSMIEPCFPIDCTGMIDEIVIA